MGIWNEPGPTEVVPQVTVIVSKQVLVHVTVSVIVAVAVSVTIVVPVVTVTVGGAVKVHTSFC
jgi:hypothetical protein